MISETMPLNENSSEDLNDLDDYLYIAFVHAPELANKIRQFRVVVKSAIKDAEEREAKLPFE
jgi:hypothetical protein